MKVKQKLARIVGDENFIDTGELIKAYLKRVGLPSSPAPQIVVFPQDPLTIQKIIQVANDYNISVTPASSTLHLHKGAIPLKGGIILDLKKLNNISPIDVRNRIVRIGPGVTWAQLTNALRPYGMMVISPFCVHPETSVLSCMLDREPCMDPRFEIGEPITSMELVWPTGERFRTGTASSIDFGRNMAHGAYPYGPGPMDPIRLIQGSQGTMGVVTWGNIKMEFRPELNEGLLLPFDTSQPLVEAIYAIQKHKIGRECFGLNRTLLKKVLCQIMDIRPRYFDKDLPHWALLLVLSGGKWFPKEKITYEMEALFDLTANRMTSSHLKHGLLKRSSLPNLADVLRDPWPQFKPYWRLAGERQCERLFFITRLDRAPEFIKKIQERVDAPGGRDVEQGIYVQPLDYSGGAHLEFIFFPSHTEAKSQALEELVLDSAKDALELGGHFTRPQGKKLCDLVFGKVDSSYTKLLNSIKGCIDPNYIMNPDKLCFKPRETGREHI